MSRLHDVTHKAATTRLVITGAKLNRSLSICIRFAITARRRISTSAESFRSHTYTNWGIISASLKANSRSELYEAFGLRRNI
jgi:hypothetical protein